MKQVEWSAAAVSQLAEVILIERLRSIADLRYSERERTDAAEWIASDEAGAFTFRGCCLLAGLDAEALRDGVANVARRLPRGHGPELRVSSNHPQLVHRGAL